MAIKCDIQYLVMRYCIKKKGAWWANHGFQNQECRQLYTDLMKKPIVELKEMGVFSEAMNNDWAYHKRGLIFFLTIMAWFALMLLI